MSTSFLLDVGYYSLTFSQTFCPMLVTAHNTLKSFLVGEKGNQTLYLKILLTSVIYGIKAHYGHLAQKNSQVTGYLY